MTFVRTSIQLLLFLVILFASSGAIARSETGASLEFTLSEPTIDYSFADGTKAQYKGICGLTQFQAPFYEKGRFKIGGTISYRYMEIKNVDSAYTQFGSHTGFGAGLQMNYSFLLLGVNSQSVAAKDFLTGPNAEHDSFDYNVTTLYAGLIWQFGALGLGAVYTSGQATIAPTTFTKNAEAKVQEQMLGLRLNYNFQVGTKKFFSKLFKR